MRGELAAQMTQDQMRKENIEKFKKWRSGIPDYEKRLYDRVSAMNRRVVQLRNIMIIGFLITLVVVPALIIWASPGLAAASSHKDQKGSFVRSLVKSLPGYQMRKLIRRQKELTRSIQQIYSYLNETDDQKEHLADIIKTVEKQLTSIQSEIDAQSGPSNHS